MAPSRSANCGPRTASDPPGRNPSTRVVVFCAEFGSAAAHPPRVAAAQSVLLVADTLLEIIRKLKDRYCEVADDLEHENSPDAACRTSCERNTRLGMVPTFEWLIWISDPAKNATMSR